MPAVVCILLPVCQVDLFANQLATLGYPTLGPDSTRLGLIDAAAARWGFSEKFCLNSGPIRVKCRSTDDVVSK